MALNVNYSTEAIEIVRNSGQSLVTQIATPDKRPYIHPIIAPDGAGMLTENEPEHHPWQHGLYVGLNKINGIGFWDEGLTGSPSDGTFHPAPLQPPTVSGNTARWLVDTDWRDPQGRSMLRELQQWTFTDHGETYVLDLEWTLEASQDLVFGEYPYGGLFLRMPHRHETGGAALNSEGLHNLDAEAQRARWVTVSMPIEGRTDWAGITLMDHPANPEHPVPWRVDWQLGIVPSRCIAGEWVLPQGNSARFLHRAYVYCGMHQTAAIEQCWSEFAACAPHSKEAIS